MKIRLAILSLLFTTICALSPAFAAEGEIFVVDLQKVLADSVAGKAARSNIEEENSKRSKKLEQLSKDLERERQDLLKQGSLLSRSALEEKQESFRNREKSFQRAVNDQKEELARIQRQELGKIMAEVKKVVDELALEEKASFVIERDPRLVLYVSKEFDYTDKVISKLNKRKLDI